MKRRLAGLFLFAVFSLGFAPSALAHNGPHDFWEACRLGGSGLVFLITSVVTRRVAAPANLPPAATTAVQVGTAAAGVGNAGGFYDKYGSHAVDAYLKTDAQMREANANPNAPNLLWGARP